MRAQCIAEASQTAYQVGLRQGLAEEQAKALARAIRVDLKARWSTEEFHAMARDMAQHFVEAELSRRKSEWAKQKIQTTHTLDHEVAVLRRERRELQIALAEATGETITTIGRLYGEGVEDA